MTPAEQAFFSRMVPHILAGKSFVDAGKAVLEDDQRIWLATMLDTEEGAFIRAELGRTVYQRIREDSN